MNTKRLAVFVVGVSVIVAAAAVSAVLAPTPAIAVDGPENPQQAHCVDLCIQSGNPYAYCVSLCKKILAPKDDPQ